MTASVLLSPAALLLVAVAALSVCADRYHPARGAGGRTSASVDPGERTAEFWYREAAAGVAAREARGAGGGGAARNVIMFLGDGMSVPTLAAARALRGQRAGRTGEEEQLAFETFPTVGLVKTYCVDAQIADSACTATAYLCGVKNNEATIGVTGAVPRWGCLASTDNSTHVQSIAEWALADGRDAGIVTTTRVTHASPAGAYAKVAERDWENDAEVKRSGFDTDVCPDIAMQLVQSYPATHFKVILGGGRREFLPNSTTDEEGTPGLRTDGRNLIQEWQNDKAERNVSYRYVWNRQDLMDASAAAPDYLLGLFEGGHMQYHLEADPITEPTLAELTEVAIRHLRRNEKGFFLFVEGGRIDHAHHDNFIEKALDETIELATAVQRATELLPSDDTLIVVTSDHAHVMAFNGYTRRGGDILGPSDDLGDDGVPYMTLSYANGPGARTHYDGIRPNVLDDLNYRTASWMTHAEVLLEQETHGGDDVAVFARGPQHGMFSGLYEQSQLPHLMAYAACLGPGARAPACGDHSDQPGTCEGADCDFTTPTADSDNCLSTSCEDGTDSDENASCQESACNNGRSLLATSLPVLLTTVAMLRPLLR